MEMTFGLWTLTQDGVLEQETDQHSLPLSIRTLEAARILARETLASREEIVRVVIRQTLTIEEIAR